MIESWDIYFLEIVFVSYNLYVGMRSPIKLATAIKYKTEKDATELNENMTGYVLNICLVQILNP